MHQVTFFPVGNADTSRINLENKRKILIDFANYSNEKEEDKRIKLSEELINDLEESNRDYFDVVIFTHADDDHIHGFSTFFHLEHAKKYQSDERIKIKELWVPAAVLIEKTNLNEEQKILKTEARYRLKNRKGIKVFSRPEILKEWLESEDLNFSDYKDLFINAGKIVPGFTKEKDGIEFFVHSPFSLDKNEKIEDRNEESIILQARFKNKDTETDFIICGDTTNEIWAEIVDITKYYNNEDRLSWSLFNISHHCSYLALSNEKGKNKTEAIEQIKWLFEQGKKGGVLVSSSDPISDEETTQPPHKQAAEYYRGVAKKIDGDFVVTMEWPNKKNPIPIVIKIDESGLCLEKKNEFADKIINKQTKAGKYYYG